MDDQHLGKTCTVLCDKSEVSLTNPDEVPVATMVFTMLAMVVILGCVWLLITTSTKSRQR